MLPSPLDPQRWKALALLCAAQFIVILDTSIIGVALPAIQTDLGFSDEGLSWIFNAYVIAFGGLLLLGGKLADVFGARRIFLWGFAILTASSAVAGLTFRPAPRIALMRDILSDTASSERARWPRRRVICYKG